MVAANERDVVSWSLTPGQAGDAPEGRRLIRAWGPHGGQVALLMDGAYEDDETRSVARQQGLIPVVPSHPRRSKPIPFDRCLYQQRNQIERLFRRLKAWRRLFTRYDKLDWMFDAFITVALVAKILR